MKVLHLLTILAAAAVVVSEGMEVTELQDESEKPADAFAKQDSDSNGVLSRDEFYKVGAIATGILRNRHGMCLDANKRDKPGTKVFLWTCDVKNPNVQWDYHSNSGQLKSHTGVCLDAAQRSKKGGDVRMGTCNENSKNQQWDYNSATGQVKNKHGICLDGTESDGGNVHMYPCDTANVNQQWDYISVTVSNAKKKNNCKVSAWSKFEACSKACGGGEQTRTRQVSQKPSNGGASCPAMSEKRNCNTQPCPSKINCETTAWGKWSQCTKACGGGSRLRTRAVTQAAQNGGASCPELEENKACNIQPCAPTKDCTVSQWSAFGKCSARCGGGTNSRSRTVVKKPEKGGRGCPDLTEQRPCNTHSCAVDCQVGKWGDWTVCSKKCGGGSQKRKRGVGVKAENNGKACPALSEERSCNTQACGNDCKLTQWTQWGACSLKCGGGKQMKSRSVISNAKGTGAQCGELTKSRTCNTTPCKVNCVMGQWSVFAICSAKCGGGTETRSRLVTQNAANGGTTCGHTSESRVCNDQACNLPAGTCIISSWGPYSSCSKPCGGGTQSRKRTLTKGGAACGALSQDRKCNTEGCPTNWS